MPATVQLAGACQVKVASTTLTLSLLGYTRNYANVAKEAFFVDVPGDENGGDDGPPIEIIYLGEIARIRLELTKYDNVIANNVRMRVDAATAGVPSTPGTLMFSANKGMRVLLDAPNDPRNFPNCIPRQAIEIGRGTKWSTFVCEFEAHKDATGVLYNAVTI